MGRADSPALHGTLLGRLLRYWNPVMRRLLDSRLHWPLSRWFLLLSWTGRRTGRVYTIPVSYVTDSRHVFLTTGDRWWRNVVDNESVRVRLGGRWSSARAIAVTDADESRREHDRLFRLHPWYRRLAGVPATPAPDSDTTALARSIAAGRTLVRIELAPTRPNDRDE